MSTTPRRSCVCGTACRSSRTSRRSSAVPAKWSRSSIHSPEPALKRRLTTILSADVAGYSRLMGRDEEGTHARLTALFRELLEPALAAHGGTLIKRTGDGLLAEFPSVVEAVRCAAEIQAGVGRHNAGLPLDAHARFRIGINLGDVIAEDGDIFGEGVNIAVRLEGLADPGGIVISDTVREHVRGKLLLGFEDMGEQRVRNIARPVHAFRVRAAAERGGFPRRRFWRVAAGAVAAAGAAAVAEGASKLAAAADRGAWQRILLGVRAHARLLDRSAALREPERRRAAGLLRRWRDREPDHGSLARPAWELRGRRS